MLNPAQLLPVGTFSPVSAGCIRHNIECQSPIVREADGRLFDEFSKGRFELRPLEREHFFQTFFYSQMTFQQEENGSVSKRFAVFAAIYVVLGLVLIRAQPLVQNDGLWIVVFFAYVVLAGIIWQLIKQR
jgi:hypothetical protein